MSTVLQVGSDRELTAFCARVSESARVGLDTEFHNERSYTAKLMVVQVALDDGTVGIVDPLSISDLRPLADTLHAKEVVGHALTSDLKIFADRFNEVPARIFDCQVAAAFCGYGLSISLADLVRDLLGHRLKKSQTVSDWSARPLTARQLEYLVDDVLHLLDLRERLVERLRDAGRLEWFTEECAGLAEVERYRSDAGRAYLRIPGTNRMNRRELGVLRELAALRDRIARERDVPLKYVIADDVLAGLATLRPHRLEDLQQLRR
ncbi:MAG: HRDC domain-containing protein, partial [Candidatus Eremiobacteraeota bacterium]|nr:HRDC domain-containing protein [Candidatus Eremiobacteraeota bacterium]